MLKIWDHASSVSLALGAVCLVPLHDGTFMLPVWASLTLLAFGGASQLVLKLFLQRLKN